MSYSIFKKDSSIPDPYEEWADKYIRAIWHGHWTDDEFDFAADVQDFKTKLTEEERGLIVRNLSAISLVENRVKLKWASLYQTLPWDSTANLGLVMGNNEVIHAFAYKKLISVLGIESILREHENVPCVKRRLTYLGKHLQNHYKDKEKQFLYSIALFTLFVENISLFSQFYIVLWFWRFRNALKDTNQQVSYTKNEEHLHALIGVDLINKIKAENASFWDDEIKEKIITEAKEAIDAEGLIVEWILEGYLGPRLSAEILKSFLKQRMNESLEMIGLAAIFEVDPEHARDFEWFYEEVLGNNHTDFFSQKPVDYSKKADSVDADSLFDD